MRPKKLEKEKAIYQKQRNKENEIIKIRWNSNEIGNEDINREDRLNKRIMFSME